MKLVLFTDERLTLQRALQFFPSIVASTIAFFGILPIQMAIEAPLQAVRSDLLSTNLLTPMQALMRHMFLLCPPSELGIRTTNVTPSFRVREYTVMEKTNGKKELH